MRCSQLSKIKSDRWFWRCSIRSSSNGEFFRSRTPNMVATTCVTNESSSSDANSINQMPCSDLFSSSFAVFIASRVFPDPPTPVKVTTRFFRSNCFRLEISCSRPMNVLSGKGRLLDWPELNILINRFPNVSLNYLTMDSHG